MIRPHKIVYVENKRTHPGTAEVRGRFKVKVI